MSEGGDEGLVDGGLVDDGDEEGGGLLEVMEDAAGLFLNHFTCPVLRLEHVFFIFHYVHGSLHVRLPVDNECRHPEHDE